MEDDVKLLSFIHKNAAMGTRSIPQVLSLPQSGAMRRALNSQLTEYRRIADDAQKYALARGHRVREPSSASQSMSAVMLKLQTAADHSTSRLAELMIRGSTMGTVEMTRRLHQYDGRTDSTALALGRQLLETEERNIQQMKQYL